MRNIDFDKPLSDDDKAWLRDRDRHLEIAKNEARFGDGEDLEEAAEEDPGYEKWTSSDLKEEAARRKIDFSDMKKKAELVLALREDDKAKAEAAANE